MNKRLIIIIFVALLVSVGIIVYSKKEQNLEVVPIVELENPIKSETPLSEKQDDGLSSYVLRVPFNFETYFPIGSSKLSSVETDYGTLSFPGSADEEDQNSRNPTYDVMIDGKEIGEVGGQSFSSGNFSPNKRYYIFRSRSVMGCAGTCHGVGLYVIDLKDKKVSYISYPQEGFNYQGRLAADTPFIDSYSWINEQSLRITTFLVLHPYNDNEESFYRVTPKQNWNYDTVTRKYTLLETLSE